METMKDSGSFGTVMSLEQVNEYGVCHCVCIQFAIGNETAE